MCPKSVKWTDFQVVVQIKEAIIQTVFSTHEVTVTVIKCLQDIFVDQILIAKNASNLSPKSVTDIWLAQVSF